MYLTYTSRMMECRRDGYEEGISIGLEQGAYQNKMETAKAFLSEGAGSPDGCPLHQTSTGDGAAAGRKQLSRPPKKSPPPWPVRHSGGPLSRKGAWGLVCSVGCIPHH